MDFYAVSDKQPLSGEELSSRQSLHRDTPGVEALIEPTQQVVEESMIKVSGLTGFWVCITKAVHVTRRSLKMIVTQLALLYCVER